MNVPEWLAPSFVREVQAAGATASVDAIHAAGNRLLARWCEPDRAYHDVRHLVDLLGHVDELRQETHEPHIVRLAAWYHGAIFDAEEQTVYARRGGEDEAASAEYARQDLTELGVPIPHVEAVAGLVLALARHGADRDDLDCAVLCDADLAVLASDPQRYRAYAADVRAEYAHIPARDFLEARKSILSRLLSRDRLFRSSAGAAWEAQVRNNVQGELQRIERELVASDGP